MARRKLTVRRARHTAFVAEPVGAYSSGATKSNSRKPYDMLPRIPEYAYLAKHQAVQVSRAEMSLVLVDRKDGSITPVEDVELNELFIGALRQASTGGIEEYLRRAALHLIVAGEFLHVGLPDDTGTVAWAPYAMHELNDDGSGRWQWTDGKGTKLPSETTVLRCYRPSVIDHTAADSPGQDVMPILEDLDLIGQLMRTLIQTRLNAGVLLIPDSIDIDMDIEDVTQDASQQERDDVDEFTKAIVEHITTPISNPESAASVAPMIIRGPQEALDAVRLLSLASSDFIQLAEWRKDTIVRLGQAWDAPPEQLQGKGGLNHWTGAFIENDFIGKHVEPIGVLLAAFLTEAWIPAVQAIQPNLVSVPEGLELQFRFDVSKLRAQTDTARTAQMLRDQGLMSDEAYIAALGFDPSIMPATDEERLAVLALALLMKAPIPFAPMLRLVGFPDDIVTSIEAANAQQPASAASVDPAQARATGMLRIAYDRALERAGSRVISRLQRIPAHDPIRTRLQTAPLKTVVSLLNPEDWVTLGWLSMEDAITDLFRDATSILTGADPMFPQELCDDLMEAPRGALSLGYEPERYAA